MGFDPNVAILFSGVGTLVFLVAVGGSLFRFAPEVRMGLSESDHYR
jgi:hypothetical protein